MLLKLLDPLLNDIYDYIVWYLLVVKNRSLDMFFVFLTLHHVLKQKFVTVNEHGILVTVFEDLLLPVCKRLHQYNPLTHRRRKLVYEEF